MCLATANTECSTITLKSLYLKGLAAFVIVLRNPVSISLVAVSCRGTKPLSILFPPFSAIFQLINPCLFSVFPGHKKSVLQPTRTPSHARAGEGRLTVSIPQI